MLAFHGFGLDFFHYMAFQEVLGKDYSIYSFDLFFHGRSFWPYKDQPITKKLLNEIIKKFLKENEIKEFSLMGYSLGGKIVLSILENCHENIRELILIAPDGIKLNPWYIIATKFTPIRRFFKSLITHPGRFHSVATMLNSLGLVNNSFYRFAESQMDTKEKRKRVYSTWVVFRKLKFNMNKIAEFINKNNINLIIFLGSHDRLVTRRHIKKLTNKLHKYELKILNSGHNALVENVADFLKENHGFIAKDS